MRLLAVTIVFSLPLLLGGRQCGALWSQPPTSPFSSSLVDSIGEYGLLQYLQRFSEPRRRLALYEQAVGQEAFCREYDAFLASVESKMFVRRLFTDVPMARAYRAWQSGTISADVACTRMQQQLDICKELYTERSAAYQSMARLMVDFLCRTGSYKRAMKLHEDGRDWRSNSEAPQYEWLRDAWWTEEMALYLGQSAMVMADIRHGNIADRLRQKRNPRLYFYSLTYDSLRIDYEPQFADAPRLAPLTLPKLLPVPDDEPSLAAIFGYYDALLQLPLPDKGRLYVANHILHDAEAIFWQTYDTLSFLPAIAAVQVQAAIAVARLPISSTAHDSEESLPMKFWRMAMVSERRAYGRPSARTMLAYAECWLRKGYPLNMLPLVTEAVDIMQQELAEQHPDSRTIGLQQADREWLHNHLPHFAALVDTIPAYREVMKRVES